MISVIICSVNDIFLQQLKLNIAETIGVPFEIIAIENGTLKKSISAVYNQGAQRAAFDLLCFLHEDVRIHSKDWGKSLVDLLSDQNIGLVGVSGAVYKSKYPATWASCDKSFYRTHSIQQFIDQVAPVVTCINPEGNNYSRVVVIDGVFMATRKDIFQQFQFDANTFSGFHAYDLDYSLQVGSRYAVVVSFDVLLEHFSPGGLNKQWLEASVLLHNKWRTALPIGFGAIEKNVAALSDSQACSQVLMMTITHQGSKLQAFKNYLKLITVFFRFNKLRHTKTVFKYLVSGLENAREN